MKNIARMVNLPSGISTAIRRIEAPVKPPTSLQYGAEGTEGSRYWAFIMMRGVNFFVCLISDRMIILLPALPL